MIFGPFKRLVEDTLKNMKFSDEDIEQADIRFYGRGDIPTIVSVERRPDRPNIDAFYRNRLEVMVRME